MRIRPAHLGDIEPVHDLLGRLSRTVNAPLLGHERAETLHERWHAADVMAGQLARPNFSFMVAEDEQHRIVGHALASADQMPILLVLRLYVDEAHQGRGIGTMLLEALVACHPGTTRARLSVLKGNEPALAFYGRRGFAVTGERLEEGVPVLRLERSIP